MGLGRNGGSCGIIVPSSATLYYMRCSTRTRSCTVSYVASMTCRPSPMRGSDLEIQRYASDSAATLAYENDHAYYSKRHMHPFSLQSKPSINRKITHDPYLTPTYTHRRPRPNGGRKQLLASGSCKPCSARYTKLDRFVYLHE